MQSSCIQGKHNHRNASRTKGSRWGPLRQTSRSASLLSPVWAAFNVVEKLHSAEEHLPVISSVCFGSLLSRYITVTVMTWLRIRIRHVLKKYKLFYILHNMRPAGLFPACIYIDASIFGFSFVRIRSSILDDIQYTLTFEVHTNRHLLEKFHCLHRLVTAKVYKYPKYSCWSILYK